MCTLFFPEMMTRQAEAFPLTQITRGSGGVEQLDDVIPFMKNLKPHFFHFEESPVT